jgi:hypothetical protein
VAAAAITLVSSLAIMAGRYVILANVQEDAAWWVIGFSVAVSLVAFGMSGGARKKWTGKAFKDGSDFWRKFIFTVAVAAIFGAGVATALGAYLAGGDPLVYTCAGRSVTDNDVLGRYLIAWLVLYVLLFVVTYAMIKSKG